MAIVETLEAALKPWADFYSHAKPVQAGIAFLHVGSMLVGGGFAIASDRLVLRALKTSGEQKTFVLRELHAIHTPVIMALSISVVSGILMLASDVGTFLVSPVFWTKMGLVLVLLANGYLVKSSDEALNADPSPGNRAWLRLRFSAIASIALWLSTALAGVILQNS